MIPAIRSEFRKFFTTRLWWGMAVGIFLAGAAFAALFGFLLTSEAALEGTPGAPTGAWMPSSPAPREPRPVSTAVRTSTIVWGAILVVAAIVVLATAAGMTLDLELVGIFVLGGAGLALLVGTVATQARRQR